MNKVLGVLRKFFLSASTGLLLCLPAATAVEGGTGKLDPEEYPYSINTKVTFDYHPDLNLNVQQSEVKAGLLYDAESRNIVWQKNMDATLPIASLTKMMVALLVVEDVRDGKIQWTDVLKWKREFVAGRKRHRHKYTVEMSYTLQDAFKATMIASDNECAEQLTRFISHGNLSDGVERMNRRAKELGMNDTYYGNPSGLPAPTVALDNSSTPVDQLILGLELLKYEEVLQITGMGYAQVNNGHSSCMLRNHNGLAVQHTGDVDGLKTGYTRRAGFCLVGTTAKCGHRLVSVVLGCRGPQIRNEVVRNMFNAYYTGIGLDPIGNYCPAPALQASTAPVVAEPVATTKDGQWMTLVEKSRLSHLVHPGESLSGIAAKYGCSINQMKSWNPKRIPASGAVYAGETLTVFAMIEKKAWVSYDTSGQPVAAVASRLSSGGAKKNLNKLPVKAPDAKLSSRYLYHVVAPGDTLFSIARKYGVPTVTQLIDLNDIRDPNTIVPGMKLKVKVSG